MLICIITNKYDIINLEYSLKYKLLYIYEVKELSCGLRGIHMDNYEIIGFDNNIPIRLFLHNVNVVSGHWHEGIEVLFVLSGEIDVMQSGVTYNMKEGDVLLLNSGCVHSIISKSNNLVLALQLKEDFIGEILDTEKKVEFNCNSSIKNHKEQINYDEIRNILATIFFVCDSKSSGYKLQVKSLICQFLFNLNPTKKYIDEVSLESNEKHKERLYEIIAYIDNNYMEDLTLQGVSNKYYLTPQYFSAFFKSKIGTNFSSYLNLIRLRAAEAMLSGEELSIIEISENAGFKNVQAFINSFKDRYGNTPAKYRKTIRQREVLLKRNDGNSAYLDFAASKAYDLLASYKRQNKKVIEVLERELEEKEISVLKHGTIIKKNMNSITAVSKMKELLYHNVQKQVLLAKNEIGFEFVRFHGVFDDDMMVVFGEEDNLEFSFVHIDIALDFLVNNGLKPFAEIGFMPRVLAKDQGQTHFKRKSIMSKPKDIEEWKKLIEAFFLHIIKRYGKTEVETWKFEFWNEPDINTRYWPYKKEEFFEFYAETYDTLKNINEDIRFGGPGIIAGTEPGDEFLEKFLRFSTKSNRTPDFISVHIYPIEISGVSNLVRKEISSNIQYLYDTILKVKELIYNCGCDKLPLYITEFNSCPRHDDLTHDTAYMAAYIARNLTQNFIHTDGVVFWLLSDFHEENLLPKKEFHGGMGVFTKAGIKKAAYYSLWFVSKLTGEIIEWTENYCIVKENNTIKIMFYHCAALEDSYRYGIKANISYNNRNNVFVPENPLEVKLKLKNLADGRYEEIVWDISEQSGDSWALCKLQGIHEPYDEKDIKYINSKALPSYSKRNVDVQSGEYEVKVNIPLHGVQLHILREI